MDYDDNFDFELDFDSDSENENGNENGKMISEINRIGELYAEYKTEFDEMARKMKKRLKEDDPLIHPLVIKTISELKSYLKSDCGITDDEITLEFIEPFNSLQLRVKTEVLETPGEKSKKKFDSIFQRCQGFSVTTLASGKTEITFGFHNVFIFTKSKSGDEPK